MEGINELLCSTFNTQTVHIVIKHLISSLNGAVNLSNDERVKQSGSNTLCFFLSVRITWLKVVRRRRQFTEKKRTDMLRLCW